MAQMYSAVRRRLMALRKKTVDIGEQTDAVAVQSLEEAALARRQIEDAELRVRDAKEAARDAQREAQAQIARAQAERTVSGAAGAETRGGSFAAGPGDDSSATFGATFASVSSVDGDDDGADVSIEVLRHKVAMLREQLSKSRKREEEWKRMCEQYQEKDHASEHVAEIEAARADLEKRLQTKEKLIDNLTHEIDQLREAVHRAEQQRQAEMECAVEGRRKLQAERDQTVKTLKKQADELREKCTRLQRQLEEAAGDE